MSSDKSSGNSAGPNGKKSPRVRAKVVTVKTHRGTYTCGSCGEVHRVTELGYRQLACGPGLVFVVAGGAR